MNRLAARAFYLAGSLSVFLLPIVSQASTPKAGKTLQIYFVDVEGGQATLFVTPAGQSLLIDTGWPGHDGRDADRIVAAAGKAGIRKIDFVLLLHYHQDHAGGITQLAAKIPFGAVIDHGENREHAEDTEQVWRDYQRVLAKGNVKRIIAKPGDSLLLREIQAKVVSSDGAVVKKPLPGTGASNTACKSSGPYPADKTENLRSLGTMITFGKVRILDLGDLTSDKEMELMCPANRLGHVDIYIVSHHGWIQSGSPALVHGIAPRVAIMDNGETKGGSASSWDITRNRLGLRTFGSCTFPRKAAQSTMLRIRSSPISTGPDAGNYLKVTAWKDGSFEVFNSRTKTGKHYAAAH